MADTIYSYYSVNINKNLAVALGYEKPGVLLKPEHKTNLTGRVAIQISRPPIGSSAPFKYEFVYSFCSPIDNFSKSKARNICKIRKSSGKRKVVSVHAKQLKARELSELAIDALFSDKVGVRISNGIQIPKWLAHSERDVVKPEYGR